MHELSIAQSIVDIIREEMGRHGAKTLKSVRLNIGEMSSIMHESLSFCFEVITADTPLHGARLIMETIPLKGYCRACHHEFKIKNHTFVCPLCESSKVDGISDQDLSIVEIEVE
jgi:hydrogenase nickel incorporation protein HypA/HybF